MPLAVVVLMAPTNRIESLLSLKAASVRTPQSGLSTDSSHVQAWAEIHQAELLAAWDQLQAGRPPGKIEPLR